MHDPLHTLEAPDDNEDTPEPESSPTTAIAQERGTSPLAGISGPHDFDGGTLGQTATHPESAAPDKDWNVSGPVDEHGHDNANHARGEASNRGESHSERAHKR